MIQGHQSRSGAGVAGGTSGLGGRVFKSDFDDVRCEFIPNLLISAFIEEVEKKNAAIM